MVDYFVTHIMLHTLLHDDTEVPKVPKVSVNRNWQKNCARAIQLKALAGS